MEQRNRRADFIGTNMPLGLFYDVGSYNNDAFFGISSMERLFRAC